MTTINYQLSSRKCVDWTIGIDKEIYNLSSQANDTIQDQDATVKVKTSNRFDFSKIINCV